MTKKGSPKAKRESVLWRASGIGSNVIRSRKYTIIGCSSPTVWPTVSVVEELRGICLVHANGCRLVMTPNLQVTPSIPGFPR